MRKRKLHSLSFEPPLQQAEAEPKTKDPCGLKRAEHHDTSGPFSRLCNFQHIRGGEFDFKQVPPHSPSLSGLNLECGRRIEPLAEAGAVAARSTAALSLRHAQSFVLLSWDLLLHESKKASRKTEKAQDKRKKNSYDAEFFCIFFGLT